MNTHLSARFFATCLLLLSICRATSAVEVHSPLDDAGALQKQIRSVVDRSCGSVFAVTAFLDGSSDPTLFEKSIPASRFVQIAERAQRSCGSAFAIDDDGYLLTNEHVVSGAKSVWVTNDQGNTLPALVVGTDPRGDLAVLKIPAATVALKLASQSAPDRGDIVVAIGNPGGVSITGDMAASVGNVSAVGRALPTLSAREHRFYGDLLQITTPVCTGSSGGPLIDLSGSVIGVVCAVVPSATAEQNIGFAISLSPTVLERINQLRRGEECVYGFLGVNVSAAQTDDLGEPMSGARVDDIDAGAPAAGVLQTGDVVLRFNQQPIASDIDFIRVAGTCAADVEVPITLVRQGETLDLTIRPGRRVSSIDPVQTVNQKLIWGGVTFGNSKQLGVMVLDVADSAQIPFKVGQAIRSIDRTNVTNLVQLLDVLHGSAGREMRITLRDESRASPTEFSAQPR